MLRNIMYKSLFSFFRRKDYGPLIRFYFFFDNILSNCLQFIQAVLVNLWSYILYATYPEGIIVYVHILMHEKRHKFVYLYLIFVRRKPFISSPH